MTAQSSQRTSRRFARPQVSEHAVAVTREHDGWEAFLHSANPSDPRLCHVLAKFGAPLRNAAKRQADAATGQDGGAPGFPWVTPVLGSGCLSEPDAGQLGALASKPAVLAAAVAGVNLPGGVDAANQVFEFSQSLLTQRVQELQGSDFPEAAAAGNDLSEVDRSTADCVLAAALVHRAWHESVALAKGLVRPRDTLRLPDAGVRAQEIRVALLEPARDRLEDSVRRLGRAAESDVAAMRPVVSRMLGLLSNQLSGESPRLTGFDVVGLIEVAWLMMITPEGLYPGWRDLMTTTSLQASLHRQEDGAPRGLDLAHPRPALRDVEEAADLAMRLATLRSATKRSWADRTSSRPSEGILPSRIDFYDSVAELLIAQLAYGDLSSPVPAAFVASMDVELEMSLVRRGQKFTVLVPYYFTYSEDGAEPRAMLFWLAATIDPADITADAEFDLARVDVAWRDAPETLTRMVDSVVVVRLVGSPLLPQADGAAPLFVHAGVGRLKKTRQTILERLRGLAASIAAASSEAFDESYPDQSIVPAYMLDEYSGMHQMAAVVQGGLSRNLATLEPAWFYRFWLAVGVPFDDVLVRLLVASHIDTSSGPRGLLDHHGVMVNRHVSKAESDLLAWQGFDAVHSRFASVTPDVRHYSAHMRAEVGATTSTFKQRGKCPISDGLEGEPA